jgi:hypothetical protein
MTTRNCARANDASGLRASIGSETARRCAERYAGRLQSVILTGSLARDEATWRTDGGKTRVLGDAEFLVVLDDGAPLPDAAHVHALTQQIEADLATRGVVCPITLSLVYADYLRHLRPAIFAYELRTSGRPVWGDATVLSLIPAFSGSDIPLEDGWRLLCNRLVEQLEAAPDSSELRAHLPEPVLYRTVKLHLDMATSLLVFVGQYEPTYRGRAERLRDLARQQASGDRYPFRLEPFARIVSACTEWKLEGADGPPPEGVSWESVIDRARRLWRWELARLSGVSAELPDRALMDAWLKRQPALERARGWLHVLRKCGWHRSWRLWPRWARLLRRGSPRYLVYSAACRLLFELPRVEAESGSGLPGGGVWDGVRDDLPVIRPWAAQRRALPWQEAAGEITWSYREFLVGTRA